MEFEFDKEIDAILRKARGGVETLPPAGAAAHMDADELAAFAENAVSAPARMRFTAHLADCTRCRKILSNIILSSSEAETEAASSAVSAAATAAPAERVPWYRRFLVFPQLAYTMGGAVLVFSAFFGYLIIRNLPGASNSDVSFSTEKTAPVSRPAANAAAPVTAANSNATTSTTNSSVPSIPSATSSSNSAANSAPLPAADSPIVAPKPEQREKPAENEVAVAPQATPPADVRLEDKPALQTESDAMIKNTPATTTAGAVTQNRAKEEDQKKDAMVSEDRSDDESANKLSAKRKQASPRAAEKTLSKAGATRTIGGKTFNNIGGIWYDEAVGGRKQKTVRRGTSEYSQLDGGLRSIAEQLGGTVVVLWGGKAYRIE